MLAVRASLVRKLVVTWTVSSDALMALSSCAGGDQLLLQFAGMWTSVSHVMATWYARALMQLLFHPGRQWPHLRYSYHIILYHVWTPCLRTNTPRENVETPCAFLRFWKPRSGNPGDGHVWKLATEPSPHSADGSSAADISPGGFSAARLWKAPLDGPLTQVPRER